MAPLWGLTPPLRPLNLIEVAKITGGQWAAIRLIARDWAWSIHTLPFESPLLARRLQVGAVRLVSIYRDDTSSICFFWVIDSSGILVASTLLSCGRVSVIGINTWIIGLVRIGDRWAVIRAVGNTIVIDIVVAGVTSSVIIGIGLVLVRNGGAIVSPI